MMYVWIGIILLLTLLEIITVNLTTIWYVGGAVLALITSFITDNFFIQFGVFALSGTIFLFTTRPFLSRLMKNDNAKTNFDRIIGMNGVVTEKISKNDVGEVKVDGKKWSAISNKSIEKDKVVKILSIDGVKLKVEEIEEWFYGFIYYYYIFSCYIGSS